MVSSGVRNQIFVVGCCGAAGISLPLMVAFDHQRVRLELWTENFDSMLALVKEYIINL